MLVMAKIVLTYNDGRRVELMPDVAVLAALGKLAMEHKERGDVIRDVPLRALELAKILSNR